MVPLPEKISFEKECMMHKTKVFCVGLHKTGTTSLKQALTDQGYRVATFFGIEDPEIRDNALIQGREIAKHYDAFQDDPWYLLYKELDKSYPGSKFILTKRNSELWYRSCLKHFGSRTNCVREWFYGSGLGSPVGNKNHWISRKEEHEFSVLSYFADRAEDFLEMDITQGDGWEKLAPFLGLSDVSLQFPKVNTAASIIHSRLFEKYKDSRGLMKLFYRLRIKLNKSLAK